jgi:FtsK/SpoIIIE family
LTEQQKPTGMSAIGTMLCDLSIKVSELFFKIIYLGVKNAPWRDGYLYFYMLVIGVVISGEVYAKDYLYWVAWLTPKWSWRFIMPRLMALDWWYPFTVLYGYSFILIMLTFGIKPFMKIKKFQRALDCLALKNGLGVSPKVMSIREGGPYRTKLKLRSEGIGADRYETKRDDLQSAAGAVIENIRTLDNPKYLEITFAKRKIPDVCQYRDLIAKVNEPYSFVIGESMGGLLTRSIRNLPHMLIAGTTGGGKSVFIKQTLLGLLQTSPHIQMYLLDLKRGVEVKEFGQIPNVAVAKTEKEAVKMLKAIKAEMERRFQYLESKGYKTIDPERDKLDLIIVGVDEASVLYTKTSSKSENKDLVDEARELTDNLAKLARAAGIHLILATQKVTKETVDTKVQENIGGRVCFRVNTLQGSLTVLGNKMALELPDHKGRAIWANGNDFVEVQAPFISDTDIETECQLLKHEYEQGKRKNFNPMLQLVQGGSKNGAAVATLTSCNDESSKAA